MWSSWQGERWVGSGAAPGSAPREAVVRPARFVPAAAAWPARFCRDLEGFQANLFGTTGAPGGYACAVPDRDGRPRHLSDRQRHEVDPACALDGSESVAA
eukprot:s829_g30.t1